MISSTTLNYADDIQLYITFDPKKAFSLDEALEAVTSCVTDINTWMTPNILKLNEEKTEFLVIGSVQSLRSLENACYYQYRFNIYCTFNSSQKP